MTSKSTSMETILTIAAKDMSEWSVVWSTSHIPDMDQGAGGGRRRAAGRRRLRAASLMLATCLATHCRVPACALTGGIVMFIIFLIISTGVLANPMRHFEVYLGQWSISGPGRAFRIVPMLDGVGFAICIHSIIRAVCCSCVAGIAILYVLRAISDEKLPYTHCRDFNLIPYDPIFKEIRPYQHHYRQSKSPEGDVDVKGGENDYRLNNHSNKDEAAHRRRKLFNINKHRHYKIKLCNETFEGEYPIAHRTPAFNFFYVEVTRLRPNRSLTDGNDSFNLPLVVCVTFVFLLLWGLMLTERFRHKRLIWNNVAPWLVIVPWLWVCVLLTAGVLHLLTMNRADMVKAFQFSDKEIFTILADSMALSLYIHSSGTGTELILGKGLNHYASGHIDPLLNGENLIHSGLVLLVAILHTAGSAACATAADYVYDQSTYKVYDKTYESALWILPLYSQCSVVSPYSHITAMVIFGGLVIIYMSVAYTFLKTALHTIFEYRVKLVFIEQLVVALLMILCILLSLLLTVNFGGGGVMLLESVDAVSMDMTTPLVCVMQLTALLYVYRGRDFVSDMDIATEENACASRLAIQWKLIPFVNIVCLLMKVTALVEAEMPRSYIFVAMTPLLIVLLAVPVRALHNAYAYLRPRGPPQRNGNL